MNQRTELPMDTESFVTRAQLHEMIWQEPMIRVARRFGISDVTLRRICDRYDIPRPRAGYWSKVAYGKKLEQVPLPVTKFDNLDKVRMTAPIPRTFDGAVSAIAAVMSMIQFAAEA
jgi:hypothetical protein